MKKFPFIILTIFILVSCRSEYEKLRLSNDPEKMYRAANKYYDDEEYVKAQILYESVIPFYRGKEEAEELYYKFAYTHFHLNEFILASHYFKNFATSFYNSENREEADYMSAYAKYKMSPNFRLDQTSSKEAIEAFQSFANAYPDSDRVASCNQYIDQLRAKMEAKTFDQAKLYYDLKNYNSAIRSFENMLKDYPETKRGEEIRFLILQSSYNWAEKSIYEKKEDRFEQSIKKYDLFSKKYPNSTYKREAKSIYDKSLTELNKLKDVRLKNTSAEH